MWKRTKKEELRRDGIGRSDERKKQKKEELGIFQGSKVILTQKK